ncbi:MAG: stage III sporulation AC/AD family protein [Oscillospiraceae bacterium]|nr:stage III sporulation AC/AD family protein [Oscillospiraceae bacterium]MDD7428259.1 stage III sporulation AC/AD family protein [Oscillospiraceae bacterium]MDY2847702.1 stage III sporulation AC/AD family protein [Oscillospiraceae bacterium]
MKLSAIAGLCISAAVICRIFDKTGREYGVMITTAAAVIITSLSVLALSPLVEFINSLYERTGADEQYINILYKSVGVCFLTGLAAGICRDSGENTLAVQAETAGRITLAVMALPLLEKIADIAAGLIG